MLLGKVQGSMFWQCTGLTGSAYITTWHCSSCDIQTIESNASARLQLHMLMCLVPSARNTAPLNPFACVRTHLSHACRLQRQAVARLG
jgi:hypothetical protein